MDVALDLAEFLSENRIGESIRVFPRKIGQVLLTVILQIYTPLKITILAEKGIYLDHAKYTGVILDTSSN